MAIFSNPLVTVDGLIVHYDMNNINSYKGPSITNIANAINFNGTGTTTGYSSSGVTSKEDIPGLGNVDVYTNNIQNNYNQFSPNSTLCCPSLHRWGGITVKPSTKYTYGIVYKVLSGYGTTNYMYRYEYTANGGTIVAEGGVFSSANIKALGNGWFYCLGTFTTRSTTNWLGHCGSFYYQYAQEVDSLSIAKVLIAEGDYSSLHPAYWPDSTATTTDKITNIANAQTAEASGVILSDDKTYNYKPYFKGPTNFNYLYATESVSHKPDNSFTYEAWVKINSDTGVDKIIVGKPGGHTGLMTWNNNFYFRLNAGGAFKDLSVAGSNGVWYHLVGVYINNVGSRLYKNGQLVGSSTFTTALNDYGTVLHIGGNVGWNATYTLDANIDIIRVYNRALTDSEVLQNFYAHRNRYGL